MRITTKTQYALNILKNLNKNEYISLEKIVRSENLPENYLQQITHKLKKGNIILSKKGKNGGFKLSRPLNEVNLYQLGKAVNEIELLNSNLKDIITNLYKNLTLDKAI